MIYLRISRKFKVEPSHDHWNVNIWSNFNQPPFLFTRKLWPSSLASLSTTMPAAPKPTTKKDINTKKRNVPTNGPTSLDTTVDTSDKVVSFSGGRPDKKKYDDEQSRIKTEIDALQEKLVSWLAGVITPWLTLTLSTPVRSSGQNQSCHQVWSWQWQTKHSSRRTW